MVRLFIIKSNTLSFCKYFTLKQLHNNMQFLNQNYEQTAGLFMNVNILYFISEYFNFTVIAY